MADVCKKQRVLNKAKFYSAGKSKPAVKNST